jgi:hypothetical protein
VVHGPVTNLGFLRELCGRPEVLAGDFHTTSIEDKFLPEREARLGAGGEDLLAAAAALADRFDLAGGGVAPVSARDGAEPRRAPDPFETLSGWRHPGLGPDARVGGVR